MADVATRSEEGPTVRGARASDRPARPFPHGDEEDDLVVFHDRCRLTVDALLVVEDERKIDRFTARFRIVATDGQ